MKTKPKPEPLTIRLARPDELPTHRKVRPKNTVFTQLSAPGWHEGESK